MKRLLLALLASVMLFGCSKKSREHRISLDQLTLTLPGEFTQMSAQDAAFAYVGDQVYIHGYRESKAELLQYFQSISLESYVRILAEDRDPYLDTRETDGIWNYSYTACPADEEYTFLCVFYETPDSFWRIQAGCPSDRYEENKQALWDYITKVA